jgi:uncharacterized protein (DUF885 family)
LLLAALAPHAEDQAAPKNTPAQARAQLQALFAEEWDDELRTNPEWATALGDKRFNDRLSDYSPQAIRAGIERKQKFLERFEAVNAAGFPERDVLSLSLMIRKLRIEIEGAQFKPWEMTVNQMDGPHLGLVELVNLMPFNDVQDYENYLARLRQVPILFNQTMGNLWQGMSDHLMPPRYLLEKAVVQAQDVARQMAGASPFAKPLEKFPASIPPKDRERLRVAIMAAIKSDVLPAYGKFADFLHDDYAPRGRTEPGVWALADGEARYGYEIRRLTTTSLTPDQIHEIGLKQVAATESAMLALAHQLGFPDLASLNDHIRKDRALYASSGQQLLELYQKYARQMEARLPQLFGTLPRNKLDVVPMDPFRARDAVPADYYPGAVDGSRAGRINVNEWDPEHRLLLNVEAIAYHEGVPGHHLQISIAQEKTDLPEFRRNGDYTAFVEGWALYSEQLGKEIGFYQDPYSDYGRLENEMWRAIRLVIDTGVHSKHWSRDQMVDYFHRYTAMDEPNLQTEVDRYIAWPAQALAYKLGQLDILKLREEARQKVGSGFDLRSFHDALLSQGALPLDVLDEHMEQWIAAQQKH